MSSSACQKPIENVYEKKELFRKAIAPRLNRLSLPYPNEAFCNFNKKIFQQCIYDKKENLILVPKNTLARYKIKQKNNPEEKKKIPKIEPVSTSEIKDLPEGKWAKFKIPTFVQTIKERNEYDPRVMPIIMEEINESLLDELRWKIGTDKEVGEAYDRVRSCMQGSTAAKKVYTENSDLFLVLVAYRNGATVGRCVCLKHRISPYVLPIRIYQSTAVTMTRIEWLACLQKALSPQGYKIIPQMIAKQSSAIPVKTINFTAVSLGTESIVNYVNISKNFKLRDHVYFDFGIAFHPYNKQKVITGFSSGVHNINFDKASEHNGEDLQKEIERLQELESLPEVRNFYLENKYVNILKEGSEEDKKKFKQMRIREIEALISRIDSRIC